jgi:hypothetical protein
MPRATTTGATPPQTPAGSRPVELLGGARRDPLVELVEGVLVEMVPIGAEHDGATTWLNDQFARVQNKPLRFGRPVQEIVARLRTGATTR